ncbi:MAG: hypothetical protein N4A53_04165 [Pelagimonas sp.]|jgi:hypothetical protein|nr:hypothetical protein [Pelagimonas sp.]
MRDFFAILAIILAVIALGVFRVPDENALVAAGIKAEAEGAVYQARHPLSIAVKGRVVTVSGRVESEGEELSVIDSLAALQGVEEVISDLIILPAIAPFALSLDKSPEGVVAEGHVPRARLSDQIGAALGAEIALPVATGVPDGDWADVAQRGAASLGLMRSGRFDLRDHQIRLRGVVGLPSQAASLRALWVDLPETYQLDLDLEVLDDGLPYSLLITRDPHLGLQITGKLPPDFDPQDLGLLEAAQKVDLRAAGVALDQPGFAEVALQIAPLIGDLPQGVISIGPGLVQVQGGPLPDETISKINAIDLPDSYALHLSLIPENPMPERHLTIDWDGAGLRFKGRVPRDFIAAPLAEGFGAPIAADLLDHGPYPDLQGWADPLTAGLRALRGLQSGQLVLDAQGVRLTGIAADPTARQVARSALGAAGTAQLQLADDGAPPEFTLTYDAATGVALRGKLPADISYSEIADALGSLPLRGDPRVGPDPSGAPVIRALQAVIPLLAELDGFTLTHAPDRMTFDLAVTAGSDPQALRRALGGMPEGVVLLVNRAQAPASGTRRSHVVLGVAQVFSDGLWLPQVHVDPSAEACRSAMQDAPTVPFHEGRFAPALGATYPLAHLAAVARACQRITAFDLTIKAQAAGDRPEILNRQLARRRAEAIRDALVARGVDRARITATGQAAERDQLDFLWQ